MVDDKGHPSVECWEINSFSESARVKVAGGSTAKAHSLSLARDDELAGVEILTWPTFADIWPPASDAVHSKAGLDIAFGFKYVLLPATPLIAMADKSVPQSLQCPEWSSPLPALCRCPRQSQRQG